MKFSILEYTRGGACCEPQIVEAASVRGAVESLLNEKIDAWFLDWQCWKIPQNKDKKYRVESNDGKYIFDVEVLYEES